MAGQIHQQRVCGSEREIIEYYFHCGYENKIILDFLATHHGINISLSTLKRRLREYGLRRRNLQFDEQMIRNLIERESQGPNELRGYRAVWHSLRIKHHIHVPRRKVERILREINPEASRQRRERRLRRRTYLSFGQNFCWHIDGMYKSKVFAFLYVPKCPCCPHFSSNVFSLLFL